MVPPPVGEFEDQADLPPEEVTPSGEVRDAEPGSTPLMDSARLRPWLQAAGFGVLCAMAVAWPLSRFMSRPPMNPQGTLVITTTPSGAEVTLDGRVMGTTPLRVGVEAGEHTLELQGDGEPQTLTLNVEAGALVERNVDLPPPTPPAVPASGWLTVRTPILLEVREGDRLVGSTASGSLPLPVGAHVLTFRNERLGFRTTHSVSVTAGKSTILTVDVPKGTLVVTSTPPAEVWLDGSRIGRTPLDNVPVTIGAHDLVLRHPELGDHRQLLSVTLDSPTRIAVDLRKP